MQLTQLFYSALELLCRKLSSCFRTNVVIAHRHGIYKLPHVPYSMHFAFSFALLLIPNRLLFLELLYALCPLRFYEVPDTDHGQIL
jgi:hypothetical protein